MGKTSLLPPANEVRGKVMFYTCLSFCSQWPSKQAVCILLECIQVGTVNSKSFVGKVLLRIKWKFELTVYFKHGVLGKL